MSSPFIVVPTYRKRDNFPPVSRRVPGIALRGNVAGRSGAMADKGEPST